MNDNQALPKAIQIIQGLLNAGQLQQIIDFINNQSDDLRSTAQIQKIRALVLMKLQRYAEARDTLLKVLSQNPMQHDVKHNLAFVYRQLNEFEPAIEYARAALEQAPEVVKYNLYLSLLHKENNQILKAVQVLRIALLKGVNDDELTCEFAALLNTTYEPQEALEVLDNSQESFYSLLLTLEARIQLNHYAEAMAIVPDLIKSIQNADKGSLMAFCDMLTQLGEFEKANEILSSLNHGMTYELAYSRLQSGTYYNENTKDAIEMLIQEPVLQNLSQEQSKNLDFAYSKYYFRLNKVAKGFEYCHRANAADAPGEPYKTGVKSTFNSITDAYTKNDYVNISGSNSDLPVFIIGMPRSGTTLLENIISAHSNAFGAGETPYLNLALNEMDFYANTHTERLKYLSRICDWTADDCQHMTAYYLNHLSAYDQYARKIVDKLPHNFMHLGVIQRLFPKAHIIHIKRNPVANCLSIYKENMAAFHQYGNDLRYLAEYYKQYEQLMLFWEKTQVLDNYLSITYEDLVTENEATVHQVLSFLGLEFETQCMQFHDVGRTVKTFSKEQVRNPLYTTSLEPWLGIEEHIQPLLEAFR